MKILRVINESISVIDSRNELTMDLFCSMDISFTIKVNLTEIFKYRNESKFIDEYIFKNKESIENGLLEKIKRYLLQFEIDTNFYIIYNLKNYKYDEIKFPMQKSDNFLNKLIKVITNDSEINISIPVTVFCSKKDMIYEKIKGYEKSIDNLYKEKDNYTGIMNYLKLKKIESKILEVEKEFNQYIDISLNNYLDYFKQNFEDLKLKEELYDELMQYGLLYSKDKDKFRILIHHYEKIIHCIESFKKESVELNKKEYELLVNNSVGDFQLFIFNVINKLKEEVINKVSEVIENQTKEVIINNEKINSIKTNIFNKQ